MELNKTRRNLQSYSGQSSMTIEEMMGFVKEFFEDIDEEAKRKGKESPLKTPAKDVDYLFDNLPRLLRIFISIGKSNMEVVQDPRRKEKLAQNNAKLEELERVLGREEAGARQIRETQARLERKNAELERVYALQKELRDRCDALKLDIETLSHIDLPEMEKRKDALLTEKAAVNTKIADLGDAILREQKALRAQQDILRDREQALSGAVAETKSCEDRVAKTCEAIEAEKEKKRAQESVFIDKSSELEQVRQDLQSLTEACTDLEGKIALLREEDLPKKQQQKEVLTKEREDLGDQVRALERDAGALEAELSGLKASQEEKNRTLGEASAEKNRVIKDIQQILWKIDQEKEERIRQEAALKKREEEYRQEEAVTRSRIQEEEAACTLAKTELGNAKARLDSAQEELEQLEKAQLELLGRIDQAAGLKEEKIKEDKEKEEALQREKDLIASLDEKILKTREELEILRKRSGTLQTIYREHVEEKEKLERSIESVDQAGNRLREEIRLLRQDIERKDYGAQEERLKKQKAELTALLESFDQAKQEIEQKETDLAAARREKENQDLHLQQLREKRLSLQKERDSIIVGARDLESQINALEAWLQSLDAKGLQSRCEELSARVSRIESIRDKVEADWFSDWRTGNQDLRSTCAYPSVAIRTNLENMDRTIQKYKDVLRSVVQCMESSNIKHS